MAELKTRPTAGSVSTFLEAIEDPGRRADCQMLAELLGKLTGEPAVLWGTIVGFGRYRYKYPTGNSGEWFLVGFSPRKNDLTLYIMAGFSEYEGLMARLGKHKTGKSCLYLKKLADIDLAVLEQLITASVTKIKELYPA